MALRIAAAFALLCAALSSSLNAHAEESVKNLLFEDCDQARREFLALSPEGKEKTFDFLTRVVALNTQAPNSPEAFALLPGPPAGAGPSGIRQGLDVLPGQLWQSTDAKRELRAKRCALELFLSAGASALSATPRLIAIYSEQPLSDEIAVALEETTAGIAEVAHKAGLTPPEADLDAVLPHVIGPRPLLAQNFLGEFPVLAVPQLVVFLASLPDVDAPKVQSLLQQLDPDRTRSVRAFIDSVNMVPPDRLEVLANRLSLPEPAALQAYASDIVRVTLTSGDKRNMLPLLAKTCRQLGTLPLDPTQAEAIAQGILLSDEARLSLEEKQCLTKSSSPLAARTALEVLSSDEKIVMESIALLPSTLDALNGENRAIALARLRTLSSGRNMTTAPMAIERLALFPEKRSDIVAQLLSILKTAAPPDEPPTVSSELQKAIFKTLASVGVGKDSARFTQYLLSLITSGEAFEEARPLLKANPSIESDIARLLTNSSPEVVRRALIALTDRGSLSTKSVPALLDATKTGTHASLVVAALVKAGPPAVSPIRRSLTKATSVRKIQALSALIDLKVATKTETQELAALVSTAECSLVAQTSNLLTQLTDSKHVGANQIDPLRQKVIECLPVLPPTAAVTLIRERPELFASSCADVGMKIGTSIYAPAITAALIDLALSHDGCSLIAERTILHESRELKAETLLKLAQQQKISDGLVTAVYDGPLASEADADLFYSAALVMAKHAPNRVDWKHFIREAISAAGRDEPVRRFLDVTHYLEPSIVLDEVVPALDSDAPERVVGACHIGASLGSQAVPIVSKLWHLREKRNPSIRYAAALALLEINPLTPELQDMLRQLLVNRYLGWALGRPIKWQQTVALVELPKAEFGTLRTTNLERLLVSSTGQSAEKP